jgi:hypothetical protein
MGIQSELSRRLLLMEFETAVRMLLDQGSQPHDFKVLGSTLDPTGNALMPSYSGVPPRPLEQRAALWTPDRPMMVELVARTWALRSRRWDPVDRQVSSHNTTWVTTLRKRWPGTLDCVVSCGPGWADLIEATCEWLKEQGQLGPWRQVKEKYGELRISNDDGGRFGFELVTTAEHVSGHLCEVCGALGKTTGGFYLVTRCSRHRPDDDDDE